MNLQEEFEALERVLNDPSADPIKLSHEFLENITEGFTEKNVIGKGGFGTVYSGFVNNVKVAVKKLSRTGDFSDEQFLDELKCLERVKHKNIVRCLGYCSDTQKVPMEYKGRVVMAEDRRKYICFEYAPNLSLHELLKDESSRREWETRYQLIVGICQGLQYLHNEEHINHLDLKPANILLDADMVPKITDFGLSRRFSGAQSRKITEKIRGTLGYIAPEYWNKGEISFKSDIFSLGIIIKNIIKGSTELSDFENWYKSLDLGPQLKRCIEVAQMCVDNDQHKRPSIDSVIRLLTIKENKVKIVSLVSGQPRTIQQASSISKSADGVQLLHVSAGPSSNKQQQQHQQKNSVLRGPGEESTEATTSVSKLTEKIQSIVVSTEPSSFHHHQQQQQKQQVVSVLKAPSKGITEGNSSVHDILDEAQFISSSGTSSSLQRITVAVRKGPGETSNETSKLLDVHPQELCFPFERNKLIRCPLTLTNRTEHYVGVRITLIYPDKQSGLRFPVMCGKESLEDTACFETLGPHSTLAVPMTMKGLRVPPPYDTGKFEVLMILMRQKEHLEKLMKASDTDDDFLKRAQELEGSVHEVILKASIQDQISCQAVIPNYKFLPSRTSSFRDIITDIHPTKTWLLACQKGGCDVSIWDYQTQVRLKFVQITKVGSTERRHPSREPQLAPNMARNEEDRSDAGERSRAPPPPGLGLPEDLYIHPQQEVVNPAAQLGHGQEGHHVLTTAMESETSRGSRSVAREEGRFKVAQQLRYDQGASTANDDHGDETSSHGGGVPSPSGWGGRVDMAQPPRGGYTYRHGISQVPTTTAMVRGPRWSSRSVASSAWLFRREDRVDVAAGRAAGYWRRGEGRRPRHGRHDEATRTQFIGPASRGSWGARKWVPTTTSHPRRRLASSSRHRTSVPTTTNDRCLDVRSARFIAREQWLAIGDDDGCVHIYDYSTAAVAKVAEFTAHDDGIVDLLSVHPTSQLLLTAYSFKGTIKLWNWDPEWNCTREFNVLNTRLLRLSWDPSDTNVFATLSKCNTVTLWKTDSSDPSTTMEGMNRADYLCAGSHRHLMVTSTTSHLETNDKKSAMIWDVHKNKHVHRLGLSGCDIYDIACHPTLPILATSHSDGSIVCLWNTMNYRLETILQLPDSHSPGLIFVTSTKDVTRLVTQCRDGISNVEIKMLTSTWTGIHNGGEKTKVTTKY